MSRVGFLRLLRPRPAARAGARLRQPVGRRSLPASRGLLEGNAFARCWSWVMSRVPVAGDLAVVALAGPLVIANVTGELP